MKKISMLFCLMLCLCSLCSCKRQETPLTAEDLVTAYFEKEPKTNASFDVSLFVSTSAKESQAENTESAEDEFSEALLTILGNVELNANMSVQCDENTVHIDGVLQGTALEQSIEEPAKAWVEIYPDKTVFYTYNSETEMWDKEEQPKEQKISPEKESFATLFKNLVLTTDESGHTVTGTVSLQDVQSYFDLGGESFAYDIPVTMIFDFETEQMTSFACEIPSYETEGIAISAKCVITIHTEGIPETLTIPDTITEETLNADLTQAETLLSQREGKDSLSIREYKDYLLLTEFPEDAHWTDMYFRLDESVHTLGEPLSFFTDDENWILNEERSEAKPKDKLKSGDYANIYLKHQDYVTDVTLKIYNPTNTSLAAKNCAIVAADFTGSTAEGNIDFALAGGITLDSNEDYIKGVLGEPDFYTSGNPVGYTYMDYFNGKLYLSVIARDKKVISLKIGTN